VPLRKEIKDSLNRQGLQNLRGLNRKGLAEKEEMELVLVSEFKFKRVNRQPDR